MNPLIKKEIRLLLPAWIAAMVLAMVPCWLIERFFTGEVADGDVPPPFFLMLGMLLMGITSFGSEINFKTFPLMLSQPVLRSRLWWTKISLLGIAFVSILAAAFVSWFLCICFHPYYSSRLLEPFEGMELWISVFALSSGTLWTTLLLRQVAGAFWVALFAPVGIAMVISLVLAPFPLSDQTMDRVISVAFILYSLAGFFWAQRLFLRAQDTQWTGGDFLFPWRGKNVEQTGSFVRLPRNRFLALTWKEIRLHEVGLFIAAVLLAVHLTAVVLHPMISNHNTKMVLELVWSLWLVMPLLLGSSAVAEERKLGVMDSQLCLPASRHSQFSIKFFVALILSVVLGAVMPSVIEGTRNFDVDLPHHWIYLAAVVIFFISFYASTLARSALHAIGVAIVLPFIVWFGFIAFCLLAFQVEILSPGSYYYRDYENICRAWLMLALCLLVFPLVLARLMFWNFKWLHQSAKMFRFNITSILIVFVLLFALTNAIYYRPWELLSSIEPPHGPAQLTLKTPVQFSFAREIMDSEKIIALLPDGRLWQEKIDFSQVDYRSFYFKRWFPYLYTKRFVGGSNWTEIASGGLYVLGLHQDGTLWCIPQMGAGARMTQIGSDADWRKVGNMSVGFLLLKNNGTLWLWGTNNVSNFQNAYTRLEKKIKLDLAMPPVCIDAETDWTNIVPLARYRALAQKGDGTLWSWRDKWKGNTNDTWGLFQEKNMDNQWSSYAYDWENSAEIKTNGELWLFEQPPKNWWGESDRPEVAPYTKKIKLDSNPVWKAVSFADYGGVLILLRQDGTLWKWNILDHKTFRPIQLGHYSDWVGLLNDIALAFDGSLWSWSDPSDHLWLAPSRKPVYMGNVLEGAEASQKP